MVSRRVKPNVRQVSGMIDFLKSEDGAVTVDWVVMTAATVAMGLAVMAEVREGVESLSTDISDTMSGFEIMTTFDEWDAFRTGDAPAADEQSN